MSFADLLFYCAHFVDDEIGMPIDFQRELITRLQRIEAVRTSMKPPPGQTINALRRAPPTPDEDPRQQRLFP